MKNGGILNSSHAALSLHCVSLGSLNKGAYGSGLGSPLTQILLRFTSQNFFYPDTLAEINKFFSSADEKLFGQILFFILIL